MTDPATIAKGLTREQRIALLFHAEGLAIVATSDLEELGLINLDANGRPIFMPDIGAAVAVHLRNTETGGDAP